MALRRWPVISLRLGVLIRAVDVRVNELTNWAVRPIFMVSHLQRRSVDTLILGLDSSVSESYGHQGRAG